MLQPLPAARSGDWQARQDKRSQLIEKPGVPGGGSSSGCPAVKALHPTYRMPTLDSSSFT